MIDQPSAASGRGAPIAADRGPARLLDPRWRDPAGLVLVAVAYYVGARVGLSLSLVEHNITPLWPPTGIALAAFLLVGRRTWPAVAVAALAVNLPLTDGLAPAALTAIGNTLAPLLAATAPSPGQLPTPAGPRS